MEQNNMGNEDKVKVVPEQANLERAYYQYMTAKKEVNAMGIAGFILSIIGVLFGWIPLFGNVIWLIGLILSIIGLFKAPKGLAIAGTIISFVSLIFIIIIYIGAFAAV